MQKTYYYRDLYNEVQELVDLPIPKGRHIQCGTTAKAVKGIFKTIEKALRRGETVQIVGFGTFKLAKIAPRKNHWLMHDPVTGGYMMLPNAKEKAKTYVKFTPSRDLKRFVSEGVEDEP